MQEEYNARNLEEASTLGDALLNEHWATESHGISYANDLYNLALIFDEQNQLEKAAALYVESSQHISDNDFVALAKRSNNLGGVLARMGAYEPAYQFYMQARHIYKRHLGENHPTYADSLYNMANIAAEARHTDVALQLHTEALKIRASADNPEDTINSLHSIAFIHESTGDYKKAASFAEAALKQAQSQKSEATYTRACNYLARLYDALEQHEKALEMYKQTLDKMVKSGCKRGDYLSILSRKAYLAGKTGKTEEALKHQEEAFNMYHSLTSLDLLKKDAMFYADCLRNLAILNHSLGDTAQAEDYMLKSLKSRKKASGEIIEDICFLIQLYLQEDTYDKAMDMLVYALNCAESPTGPLADSTIETLMDALGQAEDKHKLLEAMKAVNSAEKVESILEKWQDGNRP